MKNKFLKIGLITLLGSCGSPDSKDVKKNEVEELKSLLQNDVKKKYYDRNTKTILDYQTSNSIEFDQVGVITNNGFFAYNDLEADFQNSKSYFIQFQDTEIYSEGNITVTNTEAPITFKMAKEFKCGICLENYKKSAKNNSNHIQLILPCDHHFHRDCINRWLVISNSSCPSCPSCPICRSTLGNDVNYKINIVGADNDINGKKLVIDQQKVLAKASQNIDQLPNSSELDSHQFYQVIINLMNNLRGTWTRSALQDRVLDTIPSLIDAYDRRVARERDSFTIDLSFLRVVGIIEAVARDERRFISAIATRFCQDLPLREGQSIFRQDLFPDVDPSDDIYLSMPSEMALSLAVETIMQDPLQNPLLNELAVETINNYEACSQDSDSGNVNISDNESDDEEDDDDDYVYEPEDDKEDDSTFLENYLQIINFTRLLSLWSEIGL